MPNARIVFDDNAQVISPAAEAMARLGKTLAYDIPKMQMEQEERDYRRQVHADEVAYRDTRNIRSDKIQDEWIEYAKGRNIRSDKIQDEGIEYAKDRNIRSDKIQDEGIIYARGRDAKSDQDKDDARMFQNSALGIAPSMVMANTPEHQAASSLAKNVTDEKQRGIERDALQDISLGRATPDMRLAGTPHGAQQLAVHQEYMRKNAIPKGTKAGDDLMPDDLRKSIEAAAERDALGHGAMGQVEGKNVYRHFATPSADGTGGRPGFFNPEDRHQWFQDRRTFDAGYNPQTLRKIKTIEERDAIKANLESKFASFNDKGAPASTAPAAASNTPTPENMEQRKAFRAKRALLLAKQAEADPRSEYAILMKQIRAKYPAALSDNRVEAAEAVRQMNQDSPDLFRAKMRHDSAFMSSADPSGD